MTQTLMQSDLPLDNHRQGKVRDVYDATTTDGQPVTLLIASDRLSAFDVVMPTGIPDKGRVLTQLSKFWFAKIGQELGDRLSHHLISTDANDIAGLDEAQRAALRGRVMLGRRCEVVPIECVARGYLAGSGWKEYQKTQSVCGVALPEGLQQCEKLPSPIFTPATKAEEGHDENISFERACELVGEELMTTLRDLTLTLYQLGHDHAAKHGIILADTKFEFGIPVDSESKQPILIDEAMTPDSSRFWPADDYEVGRDQSSFDKQYVRNHLQALVDAGQWGKEPPGPALPDDVVANTANKYRQAYEVLTGSALDD
ncbi:phosphoribosylaminoimidazole-succinocarboxamide synthase [Algisphaera agarilytica]|uniref:Phosphoribosylaminoimidazole-succinocarboxamide synthase n=2 Tax=Algisphaera agarilytica TaxID=1385975 RepID=A0A7X0H6E8_9BACT|nr:phosphoribosylaminoimidazolesuccinocarboxamide synthase [Algisphaera agarilytica]MBB6430166.1 phosphoribosylaminoimidazole-succinocarboxamide synthase [Algisphaera agarilytica]